MDIIVYDDIKDNFHTDEMYQFPNKSIIFPILNTEFKLPPGTLPGMQQLLVLGPLQYPLQ